MVPIVSICMITYNHEKYIAQAIDSVIMQKTNYDYEIVIGEDCSTDKTREIILEYKAKYPDKVKILSQEKNVGMTQNFINTIKACNGKYIAILDGDDYWIDENKLQNQVEFLEDNMEYGLVYTTIEIQNESTKKKEYGIYKTRYYSGDVFDLLLENNFVNTLTTCFRKQLLDLSSIYETQLHFAYDHFYWLRISAASKLYFINKKTACYRIHDNNFLVSKRDSTSQERKKLEPLFYYDVLMYYFQIEKEGRNVKIQRKDILFKRLLQILFNRSIPHESKKIILRKLLHYFPGIRNSFQIIFKIIKNASKRIYNNLQS